MKSIDRRTRRHSTAAPPEPGRSPLSAGKQFRKIMTGFGDAPVRRVKPWLLAFAESLCRSRAEKNLAHLTRRTAGDGTLARPRQRLVQTTAEGLHQVSRGIGIMSLLGIYGEDELPFMARDKGLEELLSENLAGTLGLTQKAVFGGMAWLVNGNLLCGARDDGMLVRLGKDNDGWALKIPGVAPMIMQGRSMNGWVRAAPTVYGDDALRRKLLQAALDFNRSLPKK